MMFATETRRRSGVPISEPMADPTAVRDALTGLATLYPDQLFFLEDGPNPNSVVISWIPAWHVGTFLDRLMFLRSMGQGPLPWPDE